MILKGMYITASGRCAPPDNKPTPAELTTCQPYLEREIQILQPKVIVCLGKIAFDRILKIFAIRNLKFTHGEIYSLSSSSLIIHAKRSSLICSYHPSQQNTLTGKLTVEMFDEIWRKAKELSDKDG